jgi:hypothetical protein
MHHMCLRNSSTCVSMQNVEQGRHSRGIWYSKLQSNGLIHS